MGILESTHVQTMGAPYMGLIILDRAGVNENHYGWFKGIIITETHHSMGDDS